MHTAKSIAVVAHDNCKNELLDFVACNFEALSPHNLVATGTTGGLVEKLFNKMASESSGNHKLKTVNRLKSGPLGGDQQLGALIAEGKIDVLIFFWDPMQPQPHDVDVKALLRLAVLYNIPTASNRSSAEFLISSPNFNDEYKIKKVDFTEYIKRKL
ncbi:methylglyoxal synthase [Maridesulfovibrio zosterae]|uniref:methylglyoxal synthase n=1 Tax=Maridesulfovibrio zosterae TaxID=82171 RepID=UPI0004010F10|nr:methylglyoxal synthase [Maridesulfovibrio zosterae]